MILLLICSLFMIAHYSRSQLSVQPEQIHISYGGTPSTMWITWVTFDSTGLVNGSVVEFGQGKLNKIAIGNCTLFTDGGLEKRKLYIHRVLLNGLKPGTSYIYHVGSQWGWSALYYFTSLKQGSEWSPRFAVFGDMGNKNAQSLGRLQQESQKGHFDMILHVGDMAYNLDTDNARVGDDFMRQIEPMAAYVPYMTVVGNHEENYNFSNYVNRFSMPGGDSNLFYSFDVGPAHIIGLSTEFYFFVQYGWTQIATQFEWLENDLKKAAANRDKVPWIITLGHRPMYCVSADSDDCTRYQSIIRTGLPLLHAYGLEELFYKYGVDLEIWAHEHNYQRMWPVYNRTVYNGTKEPYRNPVAPVHIVTGSAGCQEDTDAFMTKPPPWSAFRSREYGYSRMQIHNGTHLYFDQVQDSNGEVIDTMWLIKDKHGPYSEEARANAGGTYIPLDYVGPNEKRCQHCSDL